MPARPVLWLFVPLLGVVELGLHFYFANRAPDSADWADLAPAVERAKRPGDLLVVAPRWAEPVARLAFGEDVMPIQGVARADESGYARALEVSLLGQTAPELAGWKELSNEAYGRFRLRRLENPKVEPVLFAFNDHVAPNQLFVAEWNGEAERVCPFTTNARATAGGLGGHIAYPRERFVCHGGEPFFVGLTIIDDQNYRPRRCIYAHAPVGQLLHLRFADVPLGKRLRGYGGLSYLVARDGIGTPIEFAAYVDGKEVGRRLFFDERGFDYFEFPLPRFGQARAEVAFEVQSASPRNREFCFEAEMR